MSDTFNCEAEPGRIIILADGLLCSDQTLIVTATSGWFLVLKADFNGKIFDLSIFDSRMIYKILLDFSTLKHQHIELKGEHNTNAYIKNKIGYPSHAVKVLSMKHSASGKIYESNSLPQSRLMYDYMVAKKNYKNWADSAIRATKISHSEFYKKYSKLHEDVVADGKQPQKIMLSNPVEVSTARQQVYKKIVTTNTFKDLDSMEKEFKPLEKRKRTRLTAFEDDFQVGSSKQPQQPSKTTDNDFHMDLFSFIILLFAHPKSRPLTS